MKRLWWVSVAVFFLGIGLGGYLAQMAQAGHEGLPHFSVPQLQFTLPEESQAPTANPLQSTKKGLPWAVENSGLIARELICYDGPYWEAGAAEDVIGVAALLLENTGNVGIEYAKIQLIQDGRTLSFDATYIPPKSSVLIPEENKVLYSEGAVTGCQGEIVIPGIFDMEARRVVIKDSGLSGLAVTNRTEEILASVRIFYKHHYGPEDLYMGGITYSTAVQNLLPGETRVIQPHLYASGYSNAVAVIVE